MSQLKAISRIEPTKPPAQPEQNIEGSQPHDSNEEVAESQVASIAGVGQENGIVDVDRCVIHAGGPMDNPKNPRQPLWYLDAECFASREITTQGDGFVASTCEGSRCWCTYKGAFVPKHTRLVELGKNIRRGSRVDDARADGHAILNYCLGRNDQLPLLPTAAELPKRPEG